MNPEGLLGMLAELERIRELTLDLIERETPPLHPAPVTPSNHTTEPHSDSRTSRIQEALARHGFYHGQIDGVASPRYTAAIRAFQTSLGDSPSGGLTQIEVVKLLNAW